MCNIAHMPLAISAAPITSATAREICATAKKFLNQRVRPAPAMAREPDFNCSTRFMRKAASAGVSPETTPAPTASKRENASARPFNEILDQPAR